MSDLVIFLHVACWKDFLVFRSGLLKFFIFKFSFFFLLFWRFCKHSKVCRHKSLKWPGTKGNKEIFTLLKQDSAHRTPVCSVFLHGKQIFEVYFGRNSHHHYVKQKWKGVSKQHVSLLPCGNTVLNLFSVGTLFCFHFLVFFPCFSTPLGILEL